MVTVRRILTPNLAAPVARLATLDRSVEPGGRAWHIGFLPLRRTIGRPDDITTAAQVRLGLA